MTNRTRRFEAATLLHLDAAYNLARWLLRDEQSANDVVQEAYLRAFRFFDGLRSEDAKPWLLRIVRNECFNWMRQSAGSGELVEFDEEMDFRTIHADDMASNPESIVLRRQEQVQVNACLARLPAAFREVLILRELEGMSYQDIARVAGIPVGTVMSRLSRARTGLKELLVAYPGGLGT